MNSFPYIIAEVASAHDGNLDRLISITDHAIQSGANAIKYQIFNRDNLIAVSNPLYDEFGIIEIAPQDWLYLLKKISSKSIDIIIEPYDIQSIQLVTKSSILCDFKSPASNINDKKYLRMLCEIGSKIYLSVGGATEEEIFSAVKFINNMNLKNEIILVCGFQNFPTKIEDSNLAQINYFKNKLGLEICYADHVDSNDSNLRKIIPLMALSAGAKYIEKHITIDRENKGRDFYSSLNPIEFKDFVFELRKYFKSIGSIDEIGKTKAEEEYRKFSKRYAVTKKVINKGSRLHIDDLYFKRTNKLGISENDIDLYIGKILKLNLSRNSQLLLEHFDD